MWFTCFWFVDAEPGVALAEGAWVATAFALHFAQGRAEGKFVPEQYREGIVRLGEQYDLVAHGKVTDDLKRRYVERADALGIGDYIRSRFMFCGTPDEVESQIRAAMEAGARNFDATGRIITPGGIESHAHIHEPMYRGWTGGADVWLQPPEGATRAAAFGGTTTVLSFAFLDVHVTDRAYDTTEAVAQRREIFTGRSFVDFAFHPVITGSASAETLASIATAVEQGTPSFKVFTTDVTTGQAGIRIDHGSVLAAMRIAQEAGGIVMVHAEDDDLIK